MAQTTAVRTLQDMVNPYVSFVCFLEKQQTPQGLESGLDYMFWVLTPGPPMH
jgi:hypothetical protein